MLSGSSSEPSRDSLIAPNAGSIPVDTNVGLAGDGPCAAHACACMRACLRSTAMREVSRGRLALGHPLLGLSAMIDLHEPSRGITRETRVLARTAAWRLRTLTVTVRYTWDRPEALVILR